MKKKVILGVLIGILVGAAATYGGIAWVLSTEEAGR